jgi:crotonobetainyl-CoA:carnitine CoA-transferase CaiB-like acyl-CoA transferase
MRWLGAGCPDGDTGRHAECGRYRSAVLEHVKVLEVSMWAYVPSCGAVLADWGADVVKVEHPREGDPLRGLSTAGVVGATADGFNAWWELYNRGKRSIGIDLTRPGGRDVILQLVAGVDVFLVSLLPAARRRFGIEVDSVMAVKPDIIYACGSGVGPVGSESEKGGYDGMTYWGRGGPQAAVTPADTAPFGMPAPAFGDVSSGLTLAGGIAAALANRAVTGSGRVVDGSLLATAAWAMQATVAYADDADATAVLTSKAAPAITNPIATPYQTEDGRWISLMMLQADKYWGDFCRVVLERPELADDPRFRDIPARTANAEECVAILRKEFAGRPVREWQERLHRQSGQWELIQTATELADDRQMVANSYVRRVQRGDHSLAVVSAPVQFDRQPAQIRPAPELGAHTEEVLLRAGFDWDRISALKEEGAIS